MLFAFYNCAPNGNAMLLNTIHLVVRFVVDRICLGRIQNTLLKDRKRNKEVRKKRMNERETYVNDVCKIENCYENAKLKMKGEKMEIGKNKINFFLFLFFILLFYPNCL